MTTLGASASDDRTIRSSANGHCQSAAKNGERGEKWLRFLAGLLVRNAEVGSSSLLPSTTQIQQNRRNRPDEPVRSTATYRHQSPPFATYHCKSTADGGRGTGSTGPVAEAACAPRSGRYGRGDLRRGPLLLRVDPERLQDGPVLSRQHVGRCQHRPPELRATAARRDLTRPCDHDDLATFLALETRASVRHAITFQARLLWLVREDVHQRRVTVSVRLHHQQPPRACRLVEHSAHDDRLRPRRRHG